MSPSAAEPSPAALPPEPPASPLPSATESPPSPPPVELPLSELEFTGCKAVPMSYDQFRRYDGRLEVWDAESRTAWMVSEPTSPTHENPSHGLAGLVERIAAVRGSSIKCYGSMDLLVRDAHGNPRRIMQADQTVYLYPRRGGVAGGECDGGGEAQLSGRGAGGGPHDGRSAREAEAVRVVGVSGVVG